MSGSMRRVWKRNYCEGIRATPDERGGKRQTGPNVTAPQLYSTVKFTLMSNFLPNLASLQILWHTNPGWELECINIQSFSPGEAYTVAIGNWSGRRHYYRYPVSVEKTRTSIVISNYRRPPEWPDRSDWNYIPGILTIRLSRSDAPDCLTWERTSPRKKSTLKPEIEWRYFASDPRLGPPQPRGRIAVDKISRPLQAILRKMLLSTQRECIVSGCQVECCLEAAHLLPAKNGGEERPENMVLLRADLHRLFDAGLLSLRIDSGRIQVFAADEVFTYVENAASGQLHRSMFNFMVCEPWVQARQQLQPAASHRRVDSRVGGWGSGLPYTR